MNRRSDIAFLVFLLIGLYVAWRVRDVLLLVYVSALFAVVVSPAIRFVQKMKVAGWRPSRGFAIIVIILLGVGTLVIFVTFAVPPIYRDMIGLAADWPRRLAGFVAQLRHLPLLENLDPQALEQHLSGAVGGMVGFFVGVAGGVMWFFSWIILTAYFIVDGDRAFHWLMSLFPARQRRRLEPTMYRAEARVRHWLVGQGLLMVILGSLSAVVFGLLRIKYFYALAVFAGLANIVPIIGPLASLSLAAVVASMDSWEKVLGVLIFYAVYQQIETAFLTPRIMRTTVDLPPLAVIIALSVGGALAGVLGALVAVPTAALVAVMVDEYVVKPHNAPVGFMVDDNSLEEHVSD
jgi:predicted PurR-regulated permease PerM